MRNQNKILKFEIFSIVFVSILGILLHFAFEWSGHNMLVGIFSAVNESTWEHLKLLFYPMLISTFLGYFYFGKNISSFLCARVFAILTSLIFIVVFFYTYSGILGTNITFLNVISFFVAVIIGEYISYRLMLSNSSCDNSKALVFLGLLLFCLILFTYLPPKIGLFQDPATNGYGIINPN